jgi:hypothetical protein
VTVLEDLAWGLVSGGKCEKEEIGPRRAICCRCRSHRVNKLIIVVAETKLVAIHALVEFRCDVDVNHSMIKEMHDSICRKEGITLTEMFLLILNAMLRLPLIDISR